MGRADVITYRGSVFELLVSGRRRLRWEDGRWADGSDADLVALVAAAPAGPHPVTVPSPILPVDWSNEVWVWFHTLDALGGMGYSDRIEIVEAPDTPQVGPLPTGAIS